MEMKAPLIIYLEELYLHLIFCEFDLNGFKLEAYYQNTQLQTQHLTYSYRLIPIQT